ncbi:single-stranded DNA-binding protein [Micromonospora sp. NPDC047074]|uniref:single-stranded DNA-binding protein n=1 Tax=Micromonospora sp. NPDC047074 TaxID=3154339 RepID=UPI0033F9DB2C
MFDTYVTIVGNVLTAPEWRRTTQSNTLVANFKVASTARRLDRDSGRWVDGNSLRVRVNCWRKLAEGVAASVMVGDPVVVCGRLYTRDWTDDAGNHRTLYELEAVAVGHDLSRGRGRFQRNRPTMTTSTVEDTEAEHRVRGEATEPVPDEEAPTRPDGRPLDDDFGPSDFGAFPADRGLPVGGDGPDEPGRPVRVTGAGTVDGLLDPFDDPADHEDPASDAHDDLADEPHDDPADAPRGEPSDGPHDAPAGDSDDPSDHPLTASPGGEAGPGGPRAGRGRRGRGRVPQPA